MPTYPLINEYCLKVIFELFNHFFVNQIHVQVTNMASRFGHSFDGQAPFLH